MDFNPRSPYGERRFFCHPFSLPLIISIHAPLTGSDLPIGLPRVGGQDFNPRSPYGERPNETRWSGSNFNFNPRSPYGERLVPAKNILKKRKFQSTLPLRGATPIRKRQAAGRAISIHAPLTGSDFTVNLSHSYSPPFQSTLPLRGAT